ncbi:hypothetical protein C8R44DRAFT_982959 [Mycena epipterygia]|nr:hypothetical protein C8R44DRAFT_982959 [Mycena epipterygia]
MSRALKIPEIVHAIIAEVHDIFVSRRADLVALARTSRAFQNPALNRIWTSQDTLAHLIRCLPADLWEETTISRQPVFRILRDITPIDMERFMMYSARVKELNLGSMSAQMWEILATFALNMPEHILLPNLRSLITWGVQAESTFASMRLLLNPCLKHISWPLPVTPSNLSLLPTLARECPSLSTIHIRNYEFGVLPTPDSHNLQRLAVSTFIRRLTHLEGVTLEMVDHPAFDHLAHLPNLRSMSLFLPRRLHLSTFSLQTTGFHALQTLEFHILDLEVAVPYFPAFVKSPLGTLRVSTHKLARNSAITSLYAAVSSYVPHDTLRSLVIGTTTTAFPGSYYPFPVPAQDDIPHYLVSGDALRPLFAFSNLVSLALHSPVRFDIDDATAWLMAPAWPRLTSLTINTVTSISHPPSLTLYGLSAFARHCPALNNLEILFDARHIPPFDRTTEIWSFQQHLECLYVGASPLQNPASVASFLSGIFAGPVDIDTSLFGDNGDILHEEDADDETRERCKLWHQVSELLSIIEGAREEERHWARMAS